ncbi:MAG: TonB family protein [Candidatus Omnitrophica bacterium]|nr:TonB family protein [Candidatus Omnitrophota bacterium]MBD3269654.1 TonB family protein [Candidatus Omnitrophota bacterium]
MNKYWNRAVFISFMCHVLLFTSTPLYHFLFPFKNKSAEKKEEKTKQIEMIPEEIEKISSAEKPKPIESEPLGYQEPLPYIKNMVDKLISDDKVKLSKPETIEKDIKSIILSEAPIDKALEKNPAYMDYYRLIREKIRSNSYSNYDTKSEGEVLVSFLIIKDGSLKKVSIDSKSIPSNELKQIALRSVRDSAPFPEFPQDLQNYSHLKFNVSIYFKNN